MMLLNSFNQDIQYQMLASLVKRNTSDDLDDAKDKVVSFAESFKHWDTCMDNTGCKVIAIVGIILAVIVAFTLLTWIFRIVLCGAQQACWCCNQCAHCCQSRSDPRARATPAPNNAYAIPNHQPYYSGPPAPPDDRFRRSYNRFKGDDIEMGTVGGYKQNY
ncbi:uncharacterized protein V1516DRAFT_669720 [Lipomyces oligophaga]|uniref:uncharacterized protein n=1 Tax=Lipomyces oligophaga TaxID=45792 RepID=UPI0034CF5D1F